MTTLLTLALLLSCADVGSHDRTALASECAREPERGAQAFFIGMEIGTEQIEGMLARVDEVPNVEAWDYRFETGAGSRVLRWRSDRPLPLTIGRAYAVRADYFPGAPDASGVMVFEKERLIFASLTDQRPGRRVFRDGIPGFELAMLPAECTSRGQTRCHPSLVNVPVRASHCGESVELHHGQTALLCDAEVRILVAQQVEYSPQCADAGLPGISLTITR